MHFFELIAEYCTQNTINCRILAKKSNLILKVTFQYNIARMNKNTSEWIFSVYMFGKNHFLYIALTSNPAHILL